MKTEIEDRSDVNIMQFLQEIEEAQNWLDNWETYIRTLPEPKQKQFLSRQTCQGLRVTLKSTLDLTQVLLCEGYSYVLTGKFCQDPLEVSYTVVIIDIM